MAVLTFARSAQLVPTPSLTLKDACHAHQATCATVVRTPTLQLASTTTMVKSVQRVLTAQRVHTIWSSASQALTTLTSVLEARKVACFVRLVLPTPATVKKVAHHAVSSLTVWRALRNAHALVRTESTPQSTTLADAALVSTSRTPTTSVKVNHLMSLIVSHSFWTVAMVLTRLDLQMVHVRA